MQPTYSTLNSTLTITDSEFMNNSAQYYGGAVTVYQWSVQVTNAVTTLNILTSNFSSNKAGQDGAVVSALTPSFCHLFTIILSYSCLLYTSPSPRDATLPRMPSSA